MTTIRPEFSRPLAIDTLEDEVQSRELVATAEERQALAARFALQGMDELTATVRIAWAGPERARVRVDGRFRALVRQACVVTLQPLGQAIEEGFRIVLARDLGRTGEVVLELDEEDEPEPLEGGTVDIGELVAQQLSLAIDPYPRAPGVEFESREYGAGEEGGETPFAVLERLRSRH